MAISVQPVDGLINRLLQQNSRSSSVAERHSHHAPGRSPDQVSISSQAQTKHRNSAPAQQPTAGQEKALESHLLKLYKMNDVSGA